MPSMLTNRPAAAGRSRLLLVLPILLAISSIPGIALAAIDRNVRDRVVPASVQVAIDATWIEDGFKTELPIPLGSGTLVSPGGLVLTNAHVVERSALAETVDEFESVLQEGFPGGRLEFSPNGFVILTSDGVRPPQARFIASVAEVDETLDLAVLRIVLDIDRSTLDPGTAFPYVPLGDSASLGLGDELHIFSYPASGGDALTYTAGVVSGFNYESSKNVPDWITTDAVISGGSSGGTAVNAAGELIGVPTQGSRLDCRPGDTNDDGIVDAEDVGCIPTGGSIGQLRPINRAKPLLDRAGLSSDGGNESVAQAAAIPTAAPAPTATSRPSPTQPPRALPILAPDAADISLSWEDVQALGMGDFRLTGAAMGSGPHPLPGFRELGDAGEPPEPEGFDLAYTVEFSQRSNSIEHPVDLVARSTVWAFTDEAAATRSYPDLAQGWTGSVLLGVELPLGSERSPWKLSLPASGEAQAQTVRGVTFRTGRLVAEVVLGGGDPDEQDLFDLRDLAKSLDARLEVATGGQDSARPLSDLPIRIAGRGVTTVGDAYLLREGATPLLAGETTAEVPEWLQYWEALGIEEIYQRDSRAAGATGAADDDVGYLSEVYRFRSEDAAKAWIDRYPLERESVGDRSIEVSGWNPGLASTTVIVRSVSSCCTPARDLQRSDALVRSGSIVALVSVTSAGPIPDDVMVDLAWAQERRLASAALPLEIPVLNGFGAAAPETTAPASAAPEPGATAVPEPTAPAASQDAFEIVQPFDDSDNFDITIDSNSTGWIADGALHVRLLQPGNMQSWTWTRAPTGDLDHGIEVDFTVAEGQGVVQLWLEPVSGEDLWSFAVDPVASTWSLYRERTEAEFPYIWIEPVPFDSAVQGTPRTIGLQVVDGSPSLYVNGIDVTSGSGIPIPKMPGSMYLGYGAGVDALSSRGYSVPFEVVFSEARAFAR